MSQCGLMALSMLQDLGDGSGDVERTALADDYFRLVDLHDFCHDGLEQQLIGLVVDAIPQGDIDCVVLAPVQSSA